MEQYFVNELYWTMKPIFEKAQPKGRKFDDLKKQKDIIENAFLSSLSKEQEDKFDELMDVEADISIEEINCAFRQGVILGVNVVAEGLVLKEGES